MKVVLVLTVVSFVNANNIRNASLYPVFATNAVHPRTIRDLKNTIVNQANFGLLKNLNVPVPKMFEEEINDYLTCRGLNFNVMIDKSTYQFPKLKSQYSTNVKKGIINFEKYHRFDVIQSYLQILAWKYPNLVTLDNIGKSYEGRDLIAIKISTGGVKFKPMIFIDAGMHGNEWIAPAQALYIIQQLVENPRNSYLIKNVDWLIFPIVNPDGYEFSLSIGNPNSKYRKTRSRGKYCNGVDPNRNFNFFWGMKYGSSPNECQRTYRGPYPFSESESRAVRDLLLKYSNNIKLYLSLHASAQLIVYPWSHTMTPPLDAHELYYLARRVASVIEEVSGTYYGVGQIPHILYPTSGDSISWAKAVLGINLAYAIELPPKLIGFPLPALCIKFVVRELFEGIKAFHEHIENKYMNTIIKLS